MEEVFVALTISCLEFLEHIMRKEGLGYLTVTGHSEGSKGRRNASELPSLGEWLSDKRKRMVVTI